MLGSIAQDELLPLLDALASRDGKQVFHIITQLAEGVPDFQQILEELIYLFHKIALRQILPQQSGAEKTIEKFAQRFTPEEVQLYYQIALLGKRDLSFTPSPQQGFEMTMLRMLAFQPDLSVNSHSMLKSEKLNCSLSSAEIPLNSPQEKSPCTSDQPSLSELPNWRDLLPKLELTGMAYALASNCTLEHMSNGNVRLALSATHQPMLNQKLKDRIAESLNRYLKQSIQLEINITSAELVTPIKQQKQEQEQRLANATQTILQDSRVKQLIEMYDATIEVSLLDDS
jgi:DNA polymerase-3 subunit gamma/tau